MSTLCLTSLILFLILNLIIGYLYIEPFELSVFLRTNFLNASDLNVTSSKGSIASKLNNSFVATTPSTILVHEVPARYLINPTATCSRKSQNQSKISLLILVCTAISNLKQRESIRRTWGSVASPNNTESVRLAFLIGSTANKTLQELIQKETIQYPDVIQQDFVDSYQNLTLKSVMLLRWVSNYCPNVHYILKSDDDMYVNVPNLLKILNHLPVKSNVIYGVLFQKAKPNRHPSAKWFVPKQQFDGNMFPDYVSGTSYVMSRDVIPKLLEASATIPFLVMEDVYITGFCASQSHIKRANVKGFAHWKRPVSGCAFRDILTGHHVSPTDMQRIWIELRKKPLKCRIQQKGY